MTNKDLEIVANLLIAWEEADGKIDLDALCFGYPETIRMELERQIGLLSRASWMDDPFGEKDESDVQPGVLLQNRYELISKIGKGGASEVWEAKDHQLGRLVAVKIVNRSELDPQILSEARRLARLKHHGIVAIYDIGHDEDRSFIVTALAESGSLEGRLNQQIALEQAISWVIQIADALGHVHRSGIIHRDIKPANILLDHEGKACLADFGIAHSIIATGKTDGTLAYMSPEQIRGDLCGKTTDIYSLGVVLHQAVSGRLPYQRCSPSDLIHDIPEGKVVLSDQLPSGIKRVCKKALMLAPTDRYQTAEVFLIDLLRASRNKNRRLLLGGLGLGLIGVLTWANRAANRSEANRKIGEKLFIEDELKSVLSIAMAPDGKHFASGDIAYGLKIFDGNGLRIHSLKGHTNWVRTVAFSPDGRYLLSGSGGYANDKGLPTIGDDNTIRVWDALSGEEVRRIGEFNRPVICLAVSPDGKEVLSCGDDTAVYLWSFEGELKHRMLGHFMQIRAVAFVPKARFAVSVGDDSAIHIWGLESGKEHKKILGNLDSIDSLACSQNGQWIATGCRDKTIRIFDWRSGQEVRRMVGHTAAVTSIKFLPYDRHILSGSADNTLMLWDIETGESIERFSGHTKPISGVDVSPDGLTAISGGKEGAIRVWNLPSMKSRSPLTTLKPKSYPDETFDIEGVLQSAREAIAAKYYDLAAVRAAKILAYAPNNAEAYLILAKREHWVEDFQAMRQWLAVAIKLYSEEIERNSNRDILLQRAECWNLLGEKDKADDDRSAAESKDQSN